MAAMGPGIAGAAGNASIGRGKADLVAVPFTADNTGPGELSCSVALAHWYSSELGTAVTGASVRAMLWYDPKDGTVFLLNGRGDPVPVQILWCGVAPEAWTTRAIIRLEREADVDPTPIHVACRPEGERLACRQTLSSRHPSPAG